MSDQDRISQDVVQSSPDSEGAGVASYSEKAQGRTSSHPESTGQGNTTNSNAGVLLRRTISTVSTGTGAIESAHVGFYRGLFGGIIFLATFGGSITFQTIIQD